MTAVAALIREHRQRAKLSQEALSRLSGVDLSLVNRIESGKRTGSAATLGRLSTALGLSAEETTVLFMARGEIPPGLDPERLRAALVLVQTASVGEIRAATALVQESRKLAS